ncbi:MAG: hypothetical protein IKP31_04000 [Lachnospiraceae bacterium]|nr:hypothetical protein [Lachnospiraceae bacterium]
MATKKVSYKEPASYFNADMSKAAKDWDKKHAADKKQPAKKQTAKKK